MHVAFLGASKGSGYFALLEYLAAATTNTAVLLLRKPDVLAADPKITPHVEAGRVRFVNGDATNEEDVAKLFKDHVDVVVTSVGAAPNITWYGSISIDQPTLCTQATLALLHVLAGLEKVPRVVAVSSMGIGANHHVMPLAMRVFYSWVLGVPHRDKESLEYLLMRASAVPFTHPTPMSPLLTQEQVDSAKAGFIPEVIIVRPAFMPGGDEPARDKAHIQTAEDAYVYTVRRSEVGRFIAQDCLTGGEWVGKGPVVGYA